METVADRGRELLRMQAGKSDGDSMEEWCQKLLDGHGEASSIAIARDILQRYSDRDDAERMQFFELLYSRFGPDLSEISGTAERYFETEQDEDLLKLIQAVEPPRQELFRQLNMAPYGTKALVDMRSDLIRLARARPHLRLVDADLKHLFDSWFNRGFLRLERIEWTSPAHILEKLIAYESVHEIKGWDDLRRRLAEDRRCFAFFHPALPDEPLIFVQVALMKGIATTIPPLIDQNLPIAQPQQADTAIFYSINNTQRGLRGISFGNFLIKQVLAELQQEFPSLNTFTTLSPIPRFSSAVQTIMTERLRPGFDSDLVRNVLGDFADVLHNLTGLDDVIEALLAAVDDERNQQHEELRQALRLTVLAYLTMARRDDASLHDPVAEFHLANGAAIERINTFADVSERGLRQSFGCMVNYRYDPDLVVANHEDFVNAGTIAMSKSIARDYQRIKSMLDAAA
jgi:malonyl-CoA decarboxylase